MSSSTSTTTGRKQQQLPLATTTTTTTTTAPATTTSSSSSSSAIALSTAAAAASSANNTTGKQQLQLQQQPLPTQRPSEPTRAQAAVVSNAGGPSISRSQQQQQQSQILSRRQASVDGSSKLSSVSTPTSGASYPPKQKEPPPLRSKTASAAPPISGKTPQSEADVSPAGRSISDAASSKPLDASIGSARATAPNQTRSPITKRLETPTTSSINKSVVAATAIGQIAHNRTAVDAARQRRNSDRPSFQMGTHNDGSSHRLVRSLTSAKPKAAGTSPLPIGQIASMARPLREENRVAASTSIVPAAYTEKTDPVGILRVASAPSERPKRISFAPDVKPPSGTKPVAVASSSSPHVQSTPEFLPAPVDDGPSGAYVRKLTAEKTELESTITEQAQRISELEHKLKEAERKEAQAIKERNQAVKDLENYKKYNAVDLKTVEQYKSQLQEEHTTNAGLIIFNRSVISHNHNGS
ncbi:hypothetical protein DFJ73DRAFT_166943 [Zopfochytrium polystomum]|nr:hypothetical protein DFJ73DRAFT_166943 [Zopfochytrium polystomum]